MRAAVVTLIAGVLLMPAAARAEEPKPVETSRTNYPSAVFDLLIVRPLGLVVLPVGVAAFIPAALLTAPNGMERLQEALEHFVTSPAKYVFQRKLGEF